MIRIHLKAKLSRSASMLMWLLAEFSSLTMGGVLCLMLAIGHTEFLAKWTVPIGDN